MEKIKKFRLEISLFIIDAVGMILELVASRILSPYFGSTNIVWTCVIAVILLSSSIGHYYGGQIADSTNQKRRLNIILTIASFLILLIPITSDFLISSIVNSISNVKIGAIIATCLLFLFPSIMLGLVSPIVLKLRLANLEDAGKTAGRISAFSTLGAILGTVTGGFLLIPNLGCINILFILAMVISLVKFIVGTEIKEKDNIISLIIILSSIILIFSYSKIQENNATKILNGEENISLSYDTEYDRAIIYNYKDNTRLIKVGRGAESETYTDDRKYEPGTDYIKGIRDIVKQQSNINNTLMIGGAGYSFPKSYIAENLGESIDVVEIDDRLTNMAYKYFYLDDLTKDYNLKESDRLNIICDDGRMYLNKNEKKYDVIVNDTFLGESPAKTLTTIEAVSRIKKSLNDNGIYITNIISSLEDKNSKFLMAEGHTISKLFKYTYFLPIAYKFEDKNEELNKTTIRNILVIASNNKITNIDGAYEPEFAKNELILTDDYCPVDTLAFFE